MQYRYGAQEKGPPRLRRTFSGTNSLRKRSLPLHDAAVQERLGIGCVGINHTELCLALGGLPNLSAQTNARKNRRSETALEASHCLGMTREQQGDCMAHCHTSAAYTMSDGTLKASLLGVGPVDVLLMPVAHQTIHERPIQAIGFLVNEVGLTVGILDNILWRLLAAPTAIIYVSTVHRCVPSEE